MPPEFRSPDAGDAVEFLEAHGIVAVRPPVRSSDFRLATESPFHYLLARRFGLVPRLSWSQALNRGTWFHQAFAMMHLAPDDFTQGYANLLQLRLDELSQVCSDFGIDSEKKRAILATEEQDHSTSLAWYKACTTISLPDVGTIHDVLTAPHFRPLCAECTMEVEFRVPFFHKPARCVAQPDLMLYHTGQNSVWIVDYKTTAVSPIDRAASCPIEPQTQHYLHILEAKLQDPKFREANELPPDVRVGGMMHVIVQKPSIEFGMKDRDYLLDTSPFKSGPRKGQPRNEKVYQGEPRLENYIQRCLDWYAGEGEYAHLVADRQTSPVINISYTSAEALRDEMWRRQYHARLQSVNQWRVRKPDPGVFPWPSSVSGVSGRKDTYAPFVLRPITEWPAIVREEGFAIVRRDQVNQEDNVDE